MTWGGQCLKTWSKTLNTLALSSGEAELGAVVRASAEALGIKALLADFGFTVTLEICSDATAAIGMVRREGLGRVRHLATADLWVQQRVRQGELMVSKVDGTKNPADMMTKCLGGDKTAEFMACLLFQEASGRHELAPKIE